jgi:MFS family permease
MQLLAVFFFGACGHAMFNNGRLLISLSSLDLGANAVGVGVLIALYGLMPVLLGVTLGRVVDRVGVRLPMMFCAGLLMLAMLVPLAWLSFATLAFSSIVTGLAFMGTLVCTNKTVAALSSPENRAGRLGWLAAAASAGGAIGPVIAGFSIDHAGHQLTFGVIALIPLAALASVFVWGRGYPGGAPAASTAAHGAMRDLWRDRRLRRMLLLATVVPMALDTYLFFVPLIAAERGWSASVTGLILGFSVGAVVVARVLLPFANRLMGPWGLLAASYVAIGIGFFTLPLIEQPLTMLVVAAFVGVGTGIAPPVLTSLIYAASPPGRQGEVIGLRTSMQFGLGAVTPMIAGALGALVGMAWVFVGIGVLLAGASRLCYLRRRDAPA